MSVHYIDYALGSDSGSEALGWWKVAYTNGSGTAPIADEEVTGETSGSTAKLTVVVAPTSGDWATNDAAGTMWFYGKSAPFQAETVDGTSCTFDIAGDFSYAAWKTITYADTTASGNIFRIAKSPVPISLGITATWTYQSKEITLASALTKTVDLAEVAWTAANSATVDLTAASTDAKEGGYCMQITAPGSPATATKYAYYDISDDDFSSYQNLSFWLKNEVALSAGNWKVCLCSDDSGDTIVDEFEIPAVASTGRWLPLTIAKTGGGNLGASIKSVALYSSSVAPTGSKYVRIDCIIACTTGGLSLQSLISKNSSAQGGDEGWYGIQKIVGVDVQLDNDTNCKSIEGRGYSGATETVTTYKRETIKTDISGDSFNAQYFNTPLNEFLGGYDPVTNLQNGETFFDGLCGRGTGLKYNGGGGYVNACSHLSFSRYEMGVYLNLTGSLSSMIFGNLNNNSLYGIKLTWHNDTSINVRNAENNGSHGVYLDATFNSRFTLGEISGNTGTGLYIASSSKGIFFNGHEWPTEDLTGRLNQFKNNGVCGVEVSTHAYLNKFYFGETGGNSYASILMKGENYFYDFTSDGSIIFPEYQEGSKIFFNHFGNSHDDNRVYIKGAYSKSQSSVRHTASGLAWQMSITSPDSWLIIEDNPFELSVAKIAMKANKEVTANVWVKKSHATDIDAKFVCRGGQIAGVDADVTDTKSDDTDWEQLTLVFTPTEDGVVEFIVTAWSASTTESVYIDDFSCSQAE